MLIIGQCKKIISTDWKHEGCYKVYKHKSLNGFTCSIKSPRLSVNGTHIMIQRCVFRKHLEGFG